MIFLLKLLRFIFKFYKIEYGKYTILNKIYFPVVNKLKLKTLKLKVNKKYIMSLDLAEYIQGHLFLFNTFEPTTEKIFKKFIKKGDVAIDIGANIGYLSLLMAECVGEKGSVYSLEPVSDNFQSLNRNIHLNKFKNIKTFKLAFSDSNSIIKIFKSLDNNQGSHSMIFDSKRLNPEYEEVESLTLDSFVKMQKLMSINFIKIDVEGAEFEVIKGMDETISKYRPIIFMEINAPILQKRNIQPFVLKQLILSYDYSCFNIDDKGKLEVSHLDFNHNIDNVIFIPN